MGEVSLYSIACEMISVMLPNFLLASNIMASCFPCFIVRALDNFRVAIFKRERNTPNASKAAPTSRPTPLTNAEIEVPPAIADNVIRPVFTMPMILLNRFFFFLPAVCGPQFHLGKMSQFRSLFLIDMFVVLVVLKGLSLDKFRYHCRIYALFI